MPLLAAALCLLATPASSAEPASRPMVGVIRWDAWTAWEKYQKYLGPSEWHSRLPFFGEALSDTEVSVRGDNDEVMAQEIAYAKAAGISYWAWVWYDPLGTTGTEYHMNDVLDVYLKSPRQTDVNYCLIGTEYSLTQQWERTVATLIEHFRRPNYQRVLGGRPLYYWFNAQDVPPHFGSAEKAKAALELLRARADEAGVGRPYIVGLCFWPDKCQQFEAECGFDAMGSYCNPGGSDGIEHPYADLVANDKWYWGECVKRLKGFVPSVTSGWDPRPRRETLDTDPRWYTRATPQELAEHIREAMQVVRDNPQVCAAGSALVYAWNEFDEGGWICPTIAEGTARLDAIGEMLRNWEN